MELRPAHTACARPPLIVRGRRAALLAALAALGLPSLGAAPAAGHGVEHPAGSAPPALRPAAASADPVVAAAARHQEEHLATEQAIDRFERLPAARKRAIRNRLLGRDARSRIARRALADGDAAQVGRWTSAPFKAPDYAIHAVLLGDGRVLLFSMGSGHGVGPGSAGNYGQGLTNDGQATIWDPAQGEGATAFKDVDPPPIALDDPQGRPGASTPRPAPLFCAGQVQLADGRILIAGGNLQATSPGYGLKLLFLFDPQTDAWIREPDLLRNRWYPTLTRLPSGRVAILGGQDEGGKSVASLELYPSEPIAVAGVDPGAPTSALATSEPAQPRDNGMYAHAFVMPSGRLASSSWGAGPMALFEPTTGRWITRTTANLTLSGSYSTAFPAPGDQNGVREIVMAGGLQPTGLFNSPAITRAAYAIRPESETAWRATPPLNVARRNSTAVLLPDATAITVNGGLNELRFPLANGQLPQNLAQRRVELWDPATGSWTLGPASATPRGYHSIALLLPDGRVLSAGDDYVSTILDDDLRDRWDSTFEIYSPPYLFRGSRPQLTGAPAAAGYGETLQVRAAAERPVVRATLVAPGSVTHAIDMNQRVLQLPIAANGDGTYAVTGPTTSAAAPPGDYMLFVLNDLGVPSVASWIRIRPSYPGQGTPLLTALPGDGPAATLAPAAAPGPAPALAPIGTTPVDRKATVAKLRGFFRDSAKDTAAGLRRLAKRCPVPKQPGKTTAARARAAERLRACRARAIS